jgi:hypothetical protein
MNPRHPPDELEDAGAGVETAGPAYEDDAQLVLINVPQDVGDRCEQCNRRDVTTRIRGVLHDRNDVTAALCDGCARAGGIHA